MIFSIQPYTDRATQFKAAVTVDPRDGGFFKVEASQRPDRFSHTPEANRSEGERADHQHGMTALQQTAQRAQCGIAESRCTQWSKVQQRPVQDVLNEHAESRLARVGNHEAPEPDVSDRGDFVLFFANVTSWSEPVRSFFLNCHFHALALVEHKQYDVEGLVEYFKGQRYFLNALPAEVKEVRPSGGCLLATKGHLSCQPLPVGSFRWVASKSRFRGFDMVFVVAYFPTTGLFSSDHKALQRDIGGFLVSLNCPWVLVADFNCEPVDLHNCGWTRLVGGQICFPSTPTISTGSTLDFMVLHRALQGLVEVQVLTQVPWRPRYGVEFRLKCHALCEYVPVIPSLSPPLAVGPRWPWGKWMEGSSPEGVTLETGYRNWCKQAAGYLGSTSEECVEGLGLPVQVQWVKRVSAAARDATFQDGAVWYWSTVSRLVGDWYRFRTKNAQMALQESLYLKVQELMLRLDEFWGPTGHEPHPVALEGPVFQDPHKFTKTGISRLLSKLQDVRPAMMSKLLVTSQARVKHAVAYLQYCKRREFEKKAKKLSEAHKIIKRDEVVFVRPFQDVSVSMRAECRRHFWAEIWGETLTPFKPSKRLYQAALNQADQLSRISAPQIQQCLSHMASKKPGIDSWTLQALKQLPREGLSGLVWLFARVERELCWPEGICQVAVALLPKDADSERPISLTSFIYRLYFKLRGHLIEKWVKQLVPDTPWDGAIPGASVFDRVLGRLLRGEVMVYTGGHQVTLLLDVRKFYDSILRDELIEQALDLGFPALPLCLAMGIHAAPRFLLAEGQASCPIYPLRSILQGCPTSVALSKAYLYRILQDVSEQFPDADLASFIDDLAADLCGDDPEAVAVRITQLYVRLVEG